MYERAVKPHEMNQAFLFGAVRPVTYFYGIAVILAILFALIAPETNRPFLVGLLQWLLQSLIPITILLVVHLALSRLHVFNRMRSLLQLCWSGFIAVLLFAPIALSIDVIFQLETGITDWNQLPQRLFSELVGVGPPVLVAWIALNAPWLFGYRFERASNSGAQNTTNQDDPRTGKDPPAQAVTQPLPEFIPDDLNDLIYLKAELHYLTVATTYGRSLVLFNLRDAVSIVSTVRGVSPHRSWWVNLEHVEKYVADGRQGKLLLNDGTEVPVSRRKVDEVKKKVADKETDRTV